LQNAWEIYHAQVAEAEQLEKIQPIAQDLKISRQKTIEFPYLN
jgi:hypothetical protein